MKSPTTALVVACVYLVCIASFVTANSSGGVAPSSDLTSEEIDLLLELEYPSELYEPLEDLAWRTQEKLDALSKIENESIPIFAQRRKEVIEEIEYLTSKTEEFLDSIEELNEIEISSFTDRLEQVMEDELSRREKLSVPEDHYEVEESPGEGISIDKIEEQINVNVMIAQKGDAMKGDVYEMLMEKWFTVQDDYLNRCKKSVESKKQDLAKTIVKSPTKRDVTPCVDASEAANKIIASLNALKDDEKVNGVLSGASIVYGDKWTSDTYDRRNTNDDGEPQLKLGDARVRRYIPEDWERLLPAGWKDYDASILQHLFNANSPQGVLPTYMWHSLPSPLVSLVENSFQKAHPAPAETLLDANMHLGSCWKMSGRNGKVTLKLKQPTVIESITIDHYPWLPSAHNPKKYADHTSSAPRFMRAQGYPSCQDEDDCDPQLRFNTNGPIPFNSFEYKIDTMLSDEDDISDYQSPSSSSQTFSLSHVAVVQEDNEGGGNERNLFGQEGGCSAVKPTCDGAPGDDTTNVAIQAITLFIDENWGNPDYTCIYRLRVNAKE